MQGNSRNHYKPGRAPSGKRQKYGPGTSALRQKYLKGNLGRKAQRKQGLTRPRGLVHEAAKGMAYQAGTIVVGAIAWWWRSRF